MEGETVSVVQSWRLKAVWVEEDVKGFVADY